MVQTSQNTPIAGRMAGGAAGAAIGSVVPVLGTAIGGAIGAALGSMGGEGIGSWLGKKLFGEDEQVAKVEQSKAAAATVVQALEPARPKSGPGDVARSIAAAAPAPTAPVVAQALEQAKPKGEPAKIDQSFAFSPSNSYTIQGDVKDPAQLAREMEPYQRAQFEAWWREMSSRQSTTQLFDAAHV